MKILLLVYFFSLSFGKETTKFVAIIYRHGDRTPVDTYPTDPWRNESVWPVKFGQLTNIGKNQHYALGQWLRKRYKDFISPEFDPTEIYIRSTDVDRTLMSAQVNLAGMYPPEGSAIWNNKLMWQPIPVHTVPELQDEVLAMKKKCPAYDREMEKVVNSKAYKKRLSKYQALMDYLTAYTGRKIKSYYDIEDIYSSLTIETLYNFTLPDWAASVFPKEMRAPACYSFTTSAATPLLARLRAGPLLKDIVSKIYKSMCTKQTSHLKMAIYSGHDFTIGTMLTALGLFDSNCPVYTATIIFELVYDNSTKTNYVRILYRNSTEIVEPYVLDIPYCGKLCPVQRFTQLYENLISVNFDFECSKQFNGLLGISFLMGLMIFATIYLIHKICFARVSRENRLNSGYSNLHIASMNPVKVIQL